MQSKIPTRSIGIFVVVCLSVICILIVNFSKGATIFTPGYTILVRASSVGGLKLGASVTMSGVPIGTVKSVELEKEGKSVIIACRIEQKYAIYSDALVEIEQSGFLGDQFVAIMPAKNEGKLLTNNDRIDAGSPFNLQEAARSAVGLMQRLDSTAAKIDIAVDRVEKQLLSAHTISNLTETIASVRRATERAETAVAEIQSLVQENRPSITGSFSNAHAFSARLSELGDRLSVVSSNANQVVLNVDKVIVSNQEDVQATIANLRIATDNLKTLTTDLQAGKGLAGALLKDPRMAANVGQILTNVNTVSSNLARFGLLHKPKDSLPKPIEQGTVHKGRSAFN